MTTYAPLLAEQLLEQKQDGTEPVVTILGLDDASIVRALEQIHEARPDLYVKTQDLIRKGALAKLAASRTAAMSAMADRRDAPARSIVAYDRKPSKPPALEDKRERQVPGPEADTDALPPPQSTFEDAPVVQFSAPMYYGMEGEPSVRLNLMRIGNSESSNLDCTTIVGFRTYDVTAMAGKGYEETCGYIEFKPGEKVKVIEVPLVDDDEWNTTTEFRVALHAEGLQNATLGRFLWQSRIKVIDDDAFPTSRFHAELSNQETERIPPRLLLWEYFKLNWQDPVIRVNSILFIGLGVLLNVLFCLKMLSTMYLLDFILTDDVDVDSVVYVDLGKQLALKIIVAVILADVALTHLVEHSILSKFPIGGRARKKLQSALVRKFLNFDEDSRAAFPEADLVMALVRDIPEVVTAYNRALGLIRDISMLALIVVLNLLKPMLHNHPPSFTSALLTLLFPALLLPIIAHRDAVYKKYLAEQSHQQNRFIDWVDYMVAIIRLVIDYSKRAKYANDFESCIDDFNSSVSGSLIVLCNNHNYASWVLAALSALYVWFAAMMVMDGRLTVGMFVANYGILQKIGEDWQGIYKKILEIHSCTPAMVRITGYLNLKTDIELRKKLAKIKEDFADAEFQDTLSPDNLPIRLKTKYMNDEVRQDRSSWDGNVEIVQGTLVAFVGPRGGGKSTVLRILGGAVLPWNVEDIMCYIPLHLRVLHVSVEPLFIKGTLRDNLMFGVTPGDETDGNEKRVLGICKRLGMNDKLMELLDQEVRWDQRLSQVEAKEIMLARALIANYHVLCIHRPTMGFSDKASQNVMDLLREFVEQKGVGQDPAKLASRRPRTCIITSSKIVGVKGADEVYKVDDHKITKWEWASMDVNSMHLE